MDLVRGGRLGLRLVVEPLALATVVGIAVVLHAEPVPAGGH